MTEWERNHLKTLFREYDETKKGVTKENLVKIMERLAQDECVLGKVPNCEPESFPGLFEQWDSNEDGLVSWVEFREGINQWPWKMVDLATLERIIEDFFQKSQKFKMQGKDEESKVMATNALRLQGCISKTTPIVKEV